jgi:acetolactate synthase-1/2/3 large subunit
MAAVTGGTLVARALKKQGIEHLFILMGQQVLPILDACAAEGIRLIDVRHEQTAGYAADGWARLTGKPGCAVVTSGPGVTNCVTPVVNALQNGIPMLLIGGQLSIDSWEKSPLQEMDLVELMKPITKWARTVYETRRIPEYINTALRHSLAGKPGPVFLACPEDILRAEVEEEEVLLPEPEQTRTGSGVPGNPELVQRAARLLAAAQQPVILAGNGVFWSQASEALQQFALSLKAPVFLNSLGRGALPPEHPCLFVLSRRFAMSQADVILILGAPLDFRLDFGQPPLFPPEAKVIQVDIDQTEIGHNRLIDVGIMGDPGEVLRQLVGELPHLAGRRDESWLERVRGEERRRRQAMEPLLSSEAVPIHPLRLLAEVQRLLDKDATIIGDGGSFVSLAAQVLKPHRPGHWLDTGRFGCLGVGLGFALAARLARPGKQVVLLQGDGAFGISGIDFDTAVRHRLPFVSIIGNNGCWGTEEKERIATTGFYLGFTHYEKMVEALGGYGEFVDKPEQIRPALERAFASGVPAVVNVIIDPYAGRPEVPAQERAAAGK